MYSYLSLTVEDQCVLRNGPAHAAGGSWVGTARSCWSVTNPEATGCSSGSGGGGCWFDMAREMELMSQRFVRGGEDRW